MEVEVMGMEVLMWQEGMEVLMWQEDINGILWSGRGSSSVFF